MNKILVVLLAIGSSSVLSFEVQTDLGRVRGANLTSRLGLPFYAFRGIRYAEPPLANLRFLNPKPVKPWSPTVFDATEDGPMCPQPWENLTDVSEDCLRLNVYTKDVQGRRPVIVFLHPGGFYVFSGQSKYLAGPEPFMDRDCVLVALNYRLGSLGFLATGTAEAPGNAGLKDQVLALRWIQQHIHRFGGDPQQVTLLGYSAGSISIGLHMLSPMSRGLFHRGICMSASPYGQSKYQSSDLQLAQRQARLLKCPEEPAKDLVDCLRQKPALDYVSSYNGMFEVGWSPVLNWHVVIEEDFGQERFLVEDPFKTALRGDFYKVPLITGITEFEFLSAAFYDLRNASIIGNYNRDWEHYAPIALLYERDTNHSRLASRVLREKYLGNVKKLEYPQSLKGWGELYSDALIGVAFNRFVRLMAPHTPIYMYLFRYKGRYSFLKNPDNKQAMGPVHHDELIYLFHVSLESPLLKREDPENQMVERLTRMWFEFAAKGDPHNKTDEYLKDLQWPLYNDKDKSYLEIDTQLTAKTGGFNLERYQIWDELFPLPTS
ncbi:venom carboxylesterase-6 [Drosophila pseudoobscura]|uniref:Carboxylic ester hydrolase n=1 Tax=Drosophila pseudoobscura pseudoobscura TaxID=46245 RepID=A0A6I8USF1_DROPS|nr:venom carboxylesterase-6 [Drosophila pseudoobscura]